MLANRQKIRKSKGADDIATNPTVIYLQFCKSMLDRIVKSGVDITSAEFNAMFVKTLALVEANSKNDGVL